MFRDRWKNFLFKIIFSKFYLQQVAPKLSSIHSSQFLTYDCVSFILKFALFLVVIHLFSHKTAKNVEFFDIVRPGNKFGRGFLMSTVCANDRTVSFHNRWWKKIWQKSWSTIFQKYRHFSSILTMLAILIVEYFLICTKNLFKKSYGRYDKPLSVN